MSSQHRACRRFANAAVLRSSDAREGWSSAAEKRTSRPPGFSPKDGWMCRVFALGLPPHAYAALLEPAVQDQRRCHPDRDINRHQADQADECRKGGYRPE